MRGQVLSSGLPGSRRRRRLRRGLLSSGLPGSRRKRRMRGQVLSSVLPGSKRRRRMRRRVLSSVLPGSRRRRRMRRRVLSSELPGSRKRRRMRRRVLSSIFALQPSHLTFPKLIVPVKALGNRQAAAVKNSHLMQVGKTRLFETQGDFFSLKSIIFKHLLICWNSKVLYR
jgi:hypothetical protein